MGSTTAKALRYGPCVTRGSHSVTYHPHTNHTCFYSPAARHHSPLAGTHCAYSRRDGQAELTWVAGHIPAHGYIHIKVPEYSTSTSVVSYAINFTRLKYSKLFVSAYHFHYWLSSPVLVKQLMESLLYS